MKNLCVWLFIVASLVFSYTTQAQTNNNYGGFLGTVNSLSFLGTTGGGIDQYGMVVSTTDFTAIWNGTDVDTQNWVWWSAKSNGCSRYVVSNVVGTTATQISIVLDDVDGGGIPSNDLGVLVKESDLCELGHWIASGGVFSLQSHNQCMSSYYLYNLENCGFGSVSTDSLTIVEITPVMPDDSLSVDMALPSPCVDGAIAIYIGNGTVANPDYVWRVYDDNGDCRAIEIESPAISEFVYECADTLGGTGLQVGDAVDITATTATLAVFDGANIPDRVIVRDYGDGTYLAAHCGCWEQSEIAYTGSEDFYYFSDEVGAVNGTGLNILNDSLEINLFEVQPDGRMCVDIKAYITDDANPQYNSILPLCCNDDLQDNNPEIKDKIGAWIKGDDGMHYQDAAQTIPATVTGDNIVSTTNTVGGVFTAPIGQSPQLKLNAVNGLPSLEFKAAENDKLESQVHPISNLAGTPFELTTVFKMTAGATFASVVSMGSGNIAGDFQFEVGRIQISNFGLNFSFRYRTTSSGTTSVTIVPFSQVNDGLFHNLTVKYDGTTVNCYLDGVLELTHNPTELLFHNFVRLGRNASDSTTPDLEMAEFILSENMTAEETEITSNYIACKYAIGDFISNPTTELQCGNYQGETSYYQLLSLNNDGSVTTQYLDTTTNIITPTVPYEGMGICVGCSNDGDGISSDGVSTDTNGFAIDSGTAPSNGDAKINVRDGSEDMNTANTTTWYDANTNQKQVIIEPSDITQPQLTVNSVGGDGDNRPAAWINEDGYIGDNVANFEDCVALHVDGDVQIEGSLNYEQTKSIDNYAYAAFGGTSKRGVVVYPNVDFSTTSATDVVVFEGHTTLHSGGHSLFTFSLNPRNGLVRLLSNWSGLSIVDRIGAGFDSLGEMFILVEFKQGYYGSLRFDIIGRYGGGNSYDQMSCIDPTIVEIENTTGSFDPYNPFLSSTIQYATNEFDVFSLRELPSLPTPPSSGYFEVFFNNQKYFSTNGSAWAVIR